MSSLIELKDYFTLLGEVAFGLGLLYFGVREPSGHPGSFDWEQTIWNKLTKTIYVFLDVSYYLNLDRCLNGGPVNMDVTPQIRGPLVFAVSNNCSSVHYFSTSRVSWVTYKSAFNIVC